MRLHFRPWLRLCLLALLLAVAGCGRSAEVRYEDALERTDAASAHAVHEIRLEALMRELGRVREERLPQAFDMRDLEEQQARNVARIARAMAASAHRIPDAIPAGLAADREAEFRALAAALERQSLRLAEEAPDLTRAARRERLEAIDATCDRCHAGFRIGRSGGGGA